MERDQLLTALAGTKPKYKALVDDQVVTDIIDGMLIKHKETKKDYDLIAKYFDRGSVYDIARSLWLFCKKNLPFVEEDEDEQLVSSPFTILERGHSDCKCYALFIGGVLDACKRRGRDLCWKFKYTPTRLWSLSIGHTFVVIDEIDGKPTSVWVDPVMTAFDQHFFYLKSIDEYVSPCAAKIGYRHVRRPIVNRSRIGAAPPASSFFVIRNGSVFAADNSVRANGLTPDQMGLPYAMQILNRGIDQKFPGFAAAWWNNPPVTFWLNGQPYALPEPNTVLGGIVPLMPMGLTVQYASSFYGPGGGGGAIPSTFIKPCVALGTSGYQNKLRICPNDIPGLTSAQTTDALNANSSFLLAIIEAAVGPLVNSFSAYSYASNFGSTNNIDDKMGNHRNADDLLQPSISKTVLQQVAPVAEIAIQALNVLVPGLGVAAAGGIAAAANAGGSGGGTLSTVSPTDTATQEAEISQTSSGSPSIIQTVFSSPLFWIAIAAGVGALIFSSNGGK